MSLTSQLRGPLGEPAVSAAEMCPFTHEKPELLLVAAASLVLFCWLQVLLAENFTG